jgi:LDH2 family malate/lactate/ureidoglycolate dehydrogenase
MTDAAKPISHLVLREAVSAIFAGHGLPQHDADRVAECLVEADLRNVSSHGVNRIPIYTRRLREQLVNPRPEMQLDSPTPVVGRLNGDNGMGFVVATRAMSEAIDRAKRFGVGIVFACHSNHFGMAACYLRQALDAHMAAIVLTNASPAMPIWGGRAPFLGTSPFAMAAPGRVPLVLDMATSVAARGKIRRAAQRGEPIPEGWALDEHGRPTTDAEAGYRGIVLPLGGPKGSGLSLMMEAFAGVMSGSAFGGEVRNQYDDFETPQNVGHFFLALKPDLFMPSGEYEMRMSNLVGRAKATPLAQGYDEIMMPGEPEERTAEHRRREGIAIPEADIAMLRDEARSIGAASPF